MTRDEGVRIGAAANLLYGFKPLWDRTNSAGTPYFAPPSEPLTTFPIECANAAGGRAKFGSPEITLHDNEESLLSSLFDYSVLPFKGDEDCFEMPSGPLILGHPDRAETLRQVGRHIGVELGAGRRYMLVQIRRVDGRASHAVIRPSGEITFDKSLHLTEEGRKATIRLRPGERLQDGLRHDARITAKQAEGYMDFYYRFGTHFVSAVTWGDELFQVFAYEEEPFRIIRAAYERDCENGRLNEPVSLSYSYYTRPEFVSASGPIVSWSGDPQLQASIREGRWTDPAHAGQDSLFTAYMHAIEPPSSWLEPLAASVPIGIELTPINRFIEIFRAFNWQRVLKGALLYQYVHAIKLKLDGIAAMDQCFEPVEGSSYAGQAEQPEEHHNAAYQDLVKLDRAAGEGSCSGSLLRVSRLLDVRGSEEGIQEIRLPHSDIMLISRCIAGAAVSRRMPVVRLADEALQRTGIRCETMTGALVLVSHSGSRRYVAAEGFCFTDGELDALTGRSRVALDQRLLEREPQDWAALGPELRLSLADALLVPEASAWHEAVSYARWIVRLLSHDAVNKGLNGLQETASSLIPHIEASVMEKTDAAAAAIRPSEETEFRMMALRSQWNALRFRARQGAYGGGGQRTAAYWNSLLKLYEELIELVEPASAGAGNIHPPTPRRLVKETMDWITEQVLGIVESGLPSDIPRGRWGGYDRFINRMIGVVINELMKGEQTPWLTYHRLQPSTT